MSSRNPQHDALLERLERERRQLTAELKAQPLPVVDQMTYGSQAEAASDVFEQQRALTLRRHLERQLRAIEEAIARARQGRPDVCVDCGQLIPPERLEVVPETQWCIECQRRRERRR